MKRIIRTLTLLGLMGSFLLLFTGCDSSREVVSNIEEKEANVILVLLESKGIPASKTAAAATAIGGDSGGAKYSIIVPDKYSIEAIAYLNQNGFPRTKGTTLLDLFAKQGLMTSDKEETIRYQAGLAQQLTNTIMMIDGVIDANVQLSFPPEDTGLGGQDEEKKKITAAVYVKHQGVIDDPNIHLENKIKRLISGSVSGLDINDVTVVSDRSRFTDITLEQMPEALGGKPGEYVSIWNIVMSKKSVARFRVLFFIITAIAVLLAIVLGWISWKFYPHLKKKGGLKELFNPIPLINSIMKKPPSGPPGEGGE
ncbi:MAG: EscJ/YscJ/HrcJ family type III secretion inner membrane ring protein [Simkaniaceae bacterium]|jgi:type III secretion protein J|nr:MAG: EscJ/YscJ/HrcJ family type III secretion inner membrane ring protein [Simkaniaceae bacterium]